MLPCELLPSLLLKCPSPHMFKLSSFWTTPLSTSQTQTNLFVKLGILFLSLKTANPPSLCMWVRVCQQPAIVSIIFYIFPVFSRFPIDGYTDWTELSAKWVCPLYKFYLKLGDGVQALLIRFFFSSLLTLSKNLSYTPLYAWFVCVIYLFIFIYCLLHLLPCDA